MSIPKNISQCLCASHFHLIKIQTNHPNWTFTGACYHIDQINFFVSFVNCHHHHHFTTLCASDKVKKKKTAERVWWERQRVTRFFFVCNTGGTIIFIFFFFVEQHSNHISSWQSPCGSFIFIPRICFNFQYHLNSFLSHSIQFICRISFFFVLFFFYLI